MGVKQLYFIFGKQVTTGYIQYLSNCYASDFQLLNKATLNLVHKEYISEFGYT